MNYKINNSFNERILYKSQKNKGAVRRHISPNSENFEFLKFLDRDILQIFTKKNG
jgi:hypothetical protein